jgi:hypothetical protein
MSCDRACHSKLEPLLGENHHLSPCKRAFATKQNPMKMDGALELWETGGFRAGNANDYRFRGPSRTFQDGQGRLEIPSRSPTSTLKFQISSWVSSRILEAWCGCRALSIQDAGIGIPLFHDHSKGKTGAWYILKYLFVVEQPATDRMTDLSRASLSYRTKLA